MAGQGQHLSCDSLPKVTTDRGQFFAKGQQLEGVRLEPTHNPPVKVSRRPHHEPLNEFRNGHGISNRQRFQLQHVLPRI
eukprot:11184861-Lingulodinium_polyedra.AAC.1